MKKLMMLFLLVSFMCFGEEKTESKKSYEVIQREEIDFLKTQLMKSNNKIDDLSKKIEELENKGENNVGLTYNVDQIYQNSVQYYDKTIEFLKWLIGGMLLVLGYLKWDGNKKYEKERKEITKELDKRVERMLLENKELKEKLAGQEKNVENKLLELDKKIEESEINIEVVHILSDTRVVDKERKFEDLIERYPNLSSVYIHYGNYFYRDKREYDKALKWWEKALKIDSNNSETYLGIGVCNQKLGDSSLNNRKEYYKTALENYEIAKDINKNDKWIDERIKEIKKNLKELEEKNKKS